jgi:hypothetical protein
LIVFLLLGPPILAFVAAADMSRRGERGWLYGLLVFFLFPIGLIAWFVGRSNRLGQEDEAANRNLNF